LTAEPVTAALLEDERAPYPGARRPDRARTVIASGLRLAVYEWGDSAAPPLLLAHGGFDFAGTFDLFAPLLADGGWRVICWDQRGHGDSEHAALYSWSADMRDALAVLDSVTPGPVPFVGHSKGGSLLTSLADAAPERCSRLVNVEGLPSGDAHPPPATEELAQELADWLDHNRRAAGSARKPGTLDELARRRQRMNPRLSLEWLRYIATIGARHDPDGWRWKIDPVMRFGGIGPWRPEWALERLHRLAMPMLGVLGLIQEEMGWGTTPETVAPCLPAGARLEVLADAGHFVHIERPGQVASIVLDFLGGR
jgi:pimeloyl-ACP methyl ester carboxylesterase